MTNYLNLIYHLPTVLLVLALFGLMLAANELGFWYGLRDHVRESEQSRTVSNTLKGSIFGLVALLLGFSFSATTSRYEFRQRLVLDQANAVGTCYLRAGLLAEEPRTRIRSALRQYVHARIQLFDRASHIQELARHRGEIEGHMSELWELVEQANRDNPDAVLACL
ncbi:MAG: hypothetical protein KDA68_15005 [Planctomycetaceae bacterium]|nr:hypothetical protein [Planctomycetaceae bacterium]